MLGNFIKIAYRVFIRNRVNSLITIFGLAIGIAFSIIIFLYANKELSYDNFHTNANRIFRIGIDAKIAENKLNVPYTSSPLAAAMASNIPEVEEAVRVARFGAWLLRNDSIRYNEDNLIFTDPSFFRVFSFELVHGNPDEVLKKPYSIVLSESSAKRYFKESNPVGRKLQVENDSTYYTVTGIMKDVPENSHLSFDMVGALSTYDKLKGERWIIHYLFTYVLARDDASLDEIEEGMQNLKNKYILPEYLKLYGIESIQAFYDNNHYNFIFQPLTDIHLVYRDSGEPSSNGKYFYLYLFIVLAIVILLLACINFVNLVTAQSMNRAKEVTIRKISGSERNALIRQFLLESSIMAILALTIALLFTEVALPSFSKYIGLSLSLRQLFGPYGIALILVLVTLIGMISGLYPAWYLSAYNPKSVLRNKFTDHPDKGNFRTAVTVFQLFLAICAVAVSLITSFQFRYLINKDRGYTSEELVIIRRPDALTGNLENYKNEIKQHPGVLSVTNAVSALGGGFPRFPYNLEGTPLTQSYSSSTLLLSYNFDEVYQLELADGRFFNPDIKTDSFACVINETAAVTMNIDNPVGKTLVQLTDKAGKSPKYKIIGVVKDFNFETLENPIRPLVMALMPENLEGYLTVRISTQNQDSTIRFMKSTWERYSEAYPFVYHFLDDERISYYQPVRTTARVFFLLSVITTLMACLSLFALASFNLNRKKRDISILKTMGASQLNIIWKHIGEIFVLTLIASLAAWIGAYFMAKLWLNEYAYQVNINMLYFLVASAIILLLALLSVYYHTKLAATVNVDRSLKYE